MTEKLFTGNYLNQHRNIGHIYMILLIPLSWTIFAVTDMHSLGIYFQRLFPFLPHEDGRVMQGDYLKYLHIYWKYFLAAVFLCTPFAQKLALKLKNQKLLTAAGYIAVFLACIYCMYRGLNDPFLYFRF